MRLCSAAFPVMFLGFCIHIQAQSIPPGAPTPRSAESPPAIAFQQWPSNTSPVKQRIDPIQLQSEARQLLELSQSIQSDINQLNRGLIPKDTTGKLKQIEKLSKNLRDQISR